MKRIFFFLSFILVSSMVLLAQDCDFYFPTSQGAMIEHRHFDSRERLATVTRTTVRESGSTENGYQVKVNSEVFDNKDQLISSNELEIKCEGGSFILDMSGYFQDLNLDSYENMEVRVDSDHLLLPPNLKEGSFLPPARSRISVVNAGVPVMNMVVNVYNRKVEAIEEVTTPAGTFSCYKVSYDLETIMLFQVKSRGVEWYAKDIGLIKSETYNRSGKLTGRTILSALN
jgi:hypothetical protein